MIPAPVECPRCGKAVLFLWCFDAEAVCDDCLLLYVPANDTRRHELRLAPEQSNSGEWVEASSPDFRFLREFVDAFLRPEKYPSLKPFLTKTPCSIDSILEMMERLIPQNPDTPDAELSRIRNHAINRLKRDFALWNKGLLPVELSMPVHRVYWELLKPEGDSWDELIRHFRYLENSRNEHYETSRLKPLIDLKPDKIYVGRASFEGYVVFCYDRGQTAVLECPRVGNALYLMKLDEWKFLSQQSKKELLFQHSDHVERIAHTGNYRYEITLRLRERGIVGRPEE